MAWNEPGGNKDPWGRKTKNNSEIDTILNDINSFFKNILSGNGGGSSPTPNKKNTSILGAIIIVVYLLSGIYIVNDGERGVGLVFGAYLNWCLIARSLRIYSERVGDRKSVV